MIVFSILYAKYIKWSRLSLTLVFQWSGQLSTIGKQNTIGKQEPPLPFEFRMCSEFQPPLYKTFGGFDLQLISYTTSCGWQKNVVYRGLSELTS